MSIAQMALSIYAANEGFVDNVPLNKILAYEEGLHSHFANTQGELMSRIVSTGAWDKDIEAVFRKGIEDFTSTGSW
jgi:F-type H+-transporting ATPase subunit alpha